MVYVCVQLTDDTACRESPPPAKRSRPTDRRVTFNPNVQERALLPANEPPKHVTLKEAADVVVRYLDPFYTQGKFATKVRKANIISRLQKSCRLCNDELSAVVFFGCRSCSSPLHATCLTSLQKGGVGEKAKVSRR